MSFIPENRRFNKGLSIEEIEILGTEPVTLEQAKKYLEINFDTDNDLIESFISVCRSNVESLVNRSLISKRLRVRLDCNATEFELPYTPINSLDVIQARIGDAYEDLQVDLDYYIIDSKIHFKKYFNNLLFEYTCGSWDVFPRNASQAILQYIALFYENRLDDVKTAQLASKVPAIVAINLQSINKTTIFF